MKKVLILGISGTFSKYVAQEMQRQGWEIKAMMRDPKRLPPQFEGVEAAQGDASSIEDVRRAAEGVSVVVYGISPDNYDWEDKALPWLDITARVAEEKKLTVIFPGNIYNYNPEQLSLIDEKSPQNPISRKGEIRQNMEMRLESAAKHGAKVLIIRMGNFIAPKPIQSLLPMILQEKKGQIILQTLGDRTLKQAWAYVPDAAKAVALLLNKIDKLPTFNVFHFAGYDFSIEELGEEIKQTTGKPVVIKTFPWWFLQILRPFMVMIRGVFEMRYLWNHELLMDESKLQNTLEEVPHTPVIKALVDSGYITTE